jgi:hypothetical protein
VVLPEAEEGAGVLAGKETTMSRKDYAVMLVLMMLASFLGAMWAVFLIGYPAIAKEQPVNKVIVAEELRLVDKNGKSRVVISGSLEGAAGSGSGVGSEAVEGTAGIALQNADGTPIVLFRVFPNGLPELRFVGSAKSGPHKGEITRLATLDMFGLSFNRYQNDILSAYFGLNAFEGALRSFGEQTLGKEKAEKIYGKKKFVESAYLDLSGGEPYIRVAGKEPSLSIYDGEAGAQLDFSIFKNKPFLDIRKDKAHLGLNIIENEPSLELTDNNGNLRAVLGSTDLEKIRTGSTEKTAASSLVLFDKEGHVMWKAP